MKYEEYIAIVQADVDCAIQSILKQMIDKEKRLNLSEKGESNDPPLGDPFIYECVCNYLFLTHLYQANEHLNADFYSNFPNHKKYRCLFGICQLLDSTKPEQLKVLPYLLTAYIYNTHCAPPKYDYLKKIDNLFPENCKTIRDSSYSPYEMKKQIFFGLDVAALNAENKAGKISGDISPIFLSHMDHPNNIELLAERFRFHTASHHNPALSSIPVFSVQDIDITNPLFIPDDKYGKINKTNFHSKRISCPYSGENLCLDPIIYSFNSNAIWKHFSYWYTAVQMAAKGNLPLPSNHFDGSGDLMIHHFTIGSDNYTNDYKYLYPDNYLADLELSVKNCPELIAHSKEYISPSMSDYIIELFNSIDFSQLSSNTDPEIQTQSVATIKTKGIIPIFKSDYMALNLQQPTQDRERYPSKRDKFSQDAPTCSYKEVTSWPITIDLTPYYPEYMVPVYKTCTIIPVFGENRKKHSRVKKRLNNRAQEIFPLYAKATGASIYFTIEKNAIRQMHKVSKKTYRTRRVNFIFQIKPPTRTDNLFNWWRCKEYFPFELPLPKDYSQLSCVTFYACYDLSDLVQ